MSEEIVEKKLGIPADYQFKAIRSKNFLQAMWHRNKLAAVKKLVKIDKNTRILDLGTGSGNFELEFHAKCKEIIGVDYNDEAINFLQTQLDNNKIKNISLYQGDIRKIKALEKIGKFDLIVLIDVIEHIRIEEAQQLISDLRDFLNENGTVLIITPNYKSLWIYIEKILDKTTILPKFEGEQHLAKFYRHNLTKIFAAKNYYVDKVTSFNLFSFLSPLPSFADVLLGFEFKMPFTAGNLIAGVFRYNETQWKQDLTTWKEVYAKDQEGLYKNPIIQALFNLGHKYIARQHNASQERVLDIGSGIGYHIQFEKLTESSEYICLDSDQKMLDKIKDTRIKKICSGCEHIPLEGNSIDTIIASHILEHVPNLEATLLELKRLLKKNGKLIVALPCDPGLLWDGLTKISPSRKRLEQVGLNYNMVMSVEHINEFTECERLLSKHFKRVSREFHPTQLPSHNLNIIYTATYVQE